MHKILLCFLAWEACITDIIYAGQDRKKLFGTGRLAMQANILSFISGVHRYAIDGSEVLSVSLKFKVVSPRPNEATSFFKCKNMFVQQQ